MNILDENVPTGQRERLRRWRIHFRQIGEDVAPKGTKDTQIIPVFLRHEQFRTQAQRLGSVARLDYEAIHVWHLGAETADVVAWESN